MDMELTVTDPLCFGFETGWARVDTVYNATGAYDQLSFFWNPNPAGNSGLGEDSTWALGAGDYVLTINDENGCTRVFDFVVEEPDSMYFVEFGISAQLKAIFVLFFCKLKMGVFKASFMGKFSKVNALIPNLLVIFGLKKGV